MKLKHLLTAFACGCTAFGVTGCDRTTTLSVSKISNPVPKEARLPNITRQGNSVILSWVEVGQPAAVKLTESTVTQSQGSPGHSLVISSYERNSGWTQPSIVAHGKDWFVNWADFPSIYAADTQKLAAHWLKRSGKSTYAYDVVTSSSVDGNAWSEPYTPHLDGTKTEHGFASFFSQDNKTSLVWLDGRNTGSGSGDHAHHGDDGAGAMTLRTRKLSRNTSETASQESTLLDGRVCDCCQTTAVNTNNGAIVFYRDRTENEIRDIAFVRYDQKTRLWSKPETLHKDGWQITGCPVNGPQAAADGEFVAVTWFTAMPTPRVQLAVSKDGGATFGTPVVVSPSAPLGRVAITTLDDNRVLVAWLGNAVEETASLRTSLYSASLTQLATVEVAQISATRRSGFPRMATLPDDSAMITWTDWANNLSTVHTARIAIR